MKCALDPWVLDRTLTQDGAEVTLTGAESRVVVARADFSAWRQVRIEADSHLDVRIVWFQGTKGIQFERRYTGRSVLAHVFAACVEVYAGAGAGGPLKARCQIASSLTGLSPLEGVYSRSGTGETVPRIPVPPGAFAVSAWPRVTGETLSLTPFAAGSPLRTLLSAPSFDRLPLVGADELHLDISSGNDWLLMFHVL